VADEELSAEELARELAEEIRKLRVEDVLVQTLITVSSIGYRRLGATPETRAERDLEQTRLAIETMQTLTPLLEEAVPEQLTRDLSASVASLQLAYARAASADVGADPESPPG
jgi:hypothetical protein